MTRDMTPIQYPDGCDGLWPFGEFEAEIDRLVGGDWELWLANPFRVLDVNMGEACITIGEVAKEPY